jgi:hypothetical protein
MDALDAREGRGFDVLRDATHVGDDPGAQPKRGDRAHICRRCGRDARRGKFEDIDPEGVEPAGELDALGRTEVGARELFALTECRINHRES